MLHVACYGTIELKGAGGSFSSAVEECALAAGFDEVLFEELSDPFEVADAAAGFKGRMPVDVVFCGLGPTGATGIEVARNVRNAASTACIVLVSEGYEDAFEALELHVDGYIVAPVAADKLTRMLLRVFRRVRGYHERSIVLSTREGKRRVLASQFLYAETVDHDQVVHLADGTTYSERISSQAFFDSLKGGGRFFKAGSSYIINVRKVCCVDARQSTAAMVDGTVIPIPIRVRKSLEEAILADD